MNRKKVLAMYEEGAHVQRVFVSHARIIVFCPPVRFAVIVGSPSSLILTFLVEE